MFIAEKQLGNVLYSRPKVHKIWAMSQKWIAKLFQWVTRFLFDIAKVIWSFMEPIKHFVLYIKSIVKVFMHSDP